MLICLLKPVFYKGASLDFKYVLFNVINNLSDKMMFSHQRDITHKTMDKIAKLKGYR